MNGAPGSDDTGRPLARLLQDMNIDALDDTDSSTENLPDHVDSLAGTREQAGPLETTELRARNSTVAPVVHKSGASQLLEAGQRVAQYEVIRPLGKGGHGQVYLARDTRLGRVVALKFLMITSAEHRERFMAEARVTAQLTHENVVTLHEIGTHRDYPYMVLEYVTGHSLREWLDERILRTRDERQQAEKLGDALPSSHRTDDAHATGVSPSLAAELLYPVVQALVRSHEMGIVHRDLKPANIMLADDGAVKVLDFGIAKVLDVAERSRVQVDSLVLDADTGADTDAGLTRAGQLIGTLMYMSPEQWGVATVDGRTDLWAVGLLLHELLTGRHPLDPLSRDKLLSIPELDTPMPRLHDRHPGLGKLASIVDRCLIKDKNHRIGSARELATLLGQIVRPHHTSEVSGQEPNPYPGLYAFQESDADRFFGRTRVIAQGVRLLSEQSLLAVVGPSGAGKSSYVRAGLIPALKRSGQSWAAHIMRPGPRPMTALAELCSQQFLRATSDAATRHRAPSHADEDPLAIDRDVVEAEIRAAPGYLGTLLREYARRRLERLVLFIDQFEEIYTMASSEDRALFFACLGGVADDIGSPLRVVVSMRSDFLDRMAADSAETSERISRGMTLLRPMDRVGMREALVRPLQPSGYRFESEALVDEMLDALEDTTGALPLLQFAASRLWELRDVDRRVLSDAAYHNLGGVAGTLAQHADAVVASMAVRDGELTREVMLRMVTPERTRDLVTRGELRDAIGAEPAAIERVLARLIDARLLTSEGSGTVDSTIEIVHESLIEQWPTLARWLDENERDSEFLAKLRPAASEWQKSGRLGGFLWTGEAVDEAARWYEARKSEGQIGLGERDEAFLIAAITQAERRRVRRRRIFVGSFAGLAVIAVVVSYLAVRAYREAARVRAQKLVIQERETEARDEARRARNATRMAMAHQHRDDPTIMLSLLREAEPALEPKDASEPAGLPGGWSALAWRTLHESVADVVLAHEHPLVDARFDPQGTRVVVAQSDGAVLIWNPDGSGAPTLVGRHEKSISSAVFSPGGRRLGTASADWTARIWSVDGTGETVTLDGHENQLRSIAFSPDGRWALTSSWDATARIWPVDGTGAAVVLKANDQGLYSARFSPDGRRVIAASSDGNAYLWRVDAPEAPDEPVVLRGHADRVLSASFSPDGMRVVTSSWDQTTRIWKADGTGEPSVQRGHTGAVWSAEFSPDGRQVLTASEDKTARLSNADGSGMPVVFQGHDKGVRTAHFSSDGARVVTASTDGEVRIWAVQRESRTNVHGMPKWPYTARFSERGDFVAAALHDGSVQLTDMTGQERPRIYRHHDSAVRDLAISPDGQSIATASWDKTARLWRLDGADTAIVLPHEDAVVGIAFTPDGRHLATADMGGVVRLWSTDAPGAERHVFVGHTKAGWSVAISTDGARLLSTSFDGMVRVWSLQETADQRLGDAPIHVFKGHRGTVWSAGFSPDGTRVVSGGADATVQIWNVDGSGAPIVLTDHAEPVYRVAFSPDGTRVASASQDQTLRIWNADGSHEPLVFHGHTDAINSVAFSPSGEQLVSASKDGTIRIWSDLARVGIADPRLWTASRYCMPVADRVALLDVSEARARAHHAQCLERVGGRR